MERATRAEWAKRVRRWRSSGLRAADFAEREGWNARTLQWWGSTLRRESGPARAFIDVTPLVATASAACIEIVVRDAVRVRVPAGFDAALLRAIVAALETR